MSRRQRRKFTEEFKADAVRLALSGDRSIGQVAKDLGVIETSLRDWIRKSKIEVGEGPADALTKAEREELVRLRRENKRLGMERSILGKRRPSSRRRANEIRIHSCGEGPLPDPNSLPGPGGIGAASTRVPTTGKLFRMRESPAA
jgi:transposase